MKDQWLPWWREFWFSERVLSGLVVYAVVVAALEAMASGLPVVAANALALPELVRHGENGYLFEPGNISELADCLERVLSNNELRDVFGKRSLEIFQTHNIQRSINRFEQLYQQIAEAKPANSQNN